MLALGTQAFAGAPKQRFDCARLLESARADCIHLADSVQGQTKDALENIANSARETLERRKSKANPQYFDDFIIGDLEAVRDAITTLAKSLPDLAISGHVSEDAPQFFDVNLLSDHLDRIATEQGGNLAGFIATLALRIRGMVADPRLGTIIGRTPPISFEKWLEAYVGEDDAKNGPLAVIDLSLVPSEIIHVVISVLGRLVFESLQRYRRDHPDGKALPTVIVLEEAHTFIRRSLDDEGAVGSPPQLCRETFERIAREGRKFGLGLVLSSQRPSELSPTVLAQCNTFLLHRIVNDADQNLVARLVPDNVRGLLSELPSLPSRQAILLGWAATMPVLVDIDELPEEHRPRSADADYWDVWTRAKARNVDWKKLAKDWTA
jgi:hypothetical protein